MSGPDPVPTVEPTICALSVPPLEPNHAPLVPSMSSPDPAPTVAPTVCTLSVPSLEPNPAPLVVSTSSPTQFPVPSVAPSLCPSLNHPLEPRVPTLPPIPPTHPAPTVGPRTALHARNLHRGRSTFLRRRRWEHTASGRSGILAAVGLPATTTASCLPGQRRCQGSAAEVRQCRERNIGHILRYQLGLLCPTAVAVPCAGRPSHRRPRRGKRRVHRPKHRGSSCVPAPGGGVGPLRWMGPPQLALPSAPKSSDILCRPMGTPTTH